jgi:hypothetical protein
VRGSKNCLERPLRCGAMSGTVLLLEEKETMRRWDSEQEGLAEILSMKCRMEMAKLTVNTNHERECCLMESNVFF